VARLFEGRGAPSTGFVAIAMAVAMAQAAAPGHRYVPPSLYGFGACPTCAIYYDCDEADGHYRRARAHSFLEAQGLDGLHPFGAEAQVRANWARQGVIRLVEPRCDAQEAETPAAATAGGTAATARGAWERDFVCVRNAILTGAEAFWASKRGGKQRISQHVHLGFSWRADAIRMPRPPLVALNIPAPPGAG